MQFIISSEFKEKLSGKWIFLDNDFLSALFKEKELFQQAIKLLTYGNLIIDSLTAFEFLRDIYVPQERILREQFISKSIFIPAINQWQVLSKIQENALLLSKIYSHNGISKKKSSLVDLFLAARLMLNTNSLLITGNKKDFPSCIFDTLGVLNYEQTGDGSIRAFSLIEFNRKKFDECYSKLEKLDNLY